MKFHTLSLVYIKKKKNILIYSYIKVHENNNNNISHTIMGMRYTYTNKYSYIQIYVSQSQLKRWLLFAYTVKSNHDQTLINFPEKARYNPKISTSHNRTLQKHYRKFHVSELDAAVTLLYLVDTWNRDASAVCG